MTLTAIIGDVGKGKTLFAVGMASDETERPVIANFEIDVPTYEPLKLEDLHRKRSNGALIIIDETYALADPRKSGNDVNIYVSYIIMQMRKRKYDIILLVQLGGMLDKRFRQMASKVVVCERTSKAETADFIYTVKEKGEATKMFILPYEDAKAVFPLYDTEELIDPIDNDLLYRVQSRGNRALEAKAIAEEMVSASPADKWTQAAVEAYCMEKEYPHSAAKHVYGYLKMALQTGVFKPGELGPVPTVRTRHIGEPMDMPQVVPADVPVRQGNGRSFEETHKAFECIPMRELTAEKSARIAEIEDALNADQEQEPVYNASRIPSGLHKRRVRQGRVRQ